MALIPLRPGDPAPDFALSAVNREGQIALDDYRGRTPVLVALFRGLHCPFCRRHVVQLGTTQDKLKEMGVETVAVVNTPPERARLYFKYRPMKVLLGADPEAATHQAFRLPAGVIVEAESAASWPQSVTMGQFQAVKINPPGELPAPQNPFAALGTQLGGHFLIDREGIIRWGHVEAGERVGDLGKFPSDEEILRAARTL